jgi:hypothetical protein
MIVGSYYVDYTLSAAEATSRPHQGPPIRDHYTVAIRRRRQPGWTFRLHGDFPRHEALEIVANLNSPHRLERAA